MHDHLDGGLTCKMQNVMSTTTASMRTPGRQAAQAVWEEVFLPSLLLLPRLTAPDSSLHICWSDSMVKHVTRHRAKHKNIQLVHMMRN